MRIEVPGEAGIGAEFRVMAGGTPVWYQVKRQRDGGPWTIASMAHEGVLAPWWEKIESGGRCVFVSSTGAQELRELVERASDAESWAEFDGVFLNPEKQRSRFERLRSAWGNPSREAVYHALGRIEVRLIGEPELAGWLEARLASLVRGSLSTATAVLEQFVKDSVHRERTASDVWERLARSEITPRNLSHNAVVVGRVGTQTESYLRQLDRLFIGGRRLSRREADEAFANLVNGQRVLIAGAAGSGKSVIISQVIELAHQAEWTVLALAVDRMPEASTTSALGAALQLPPDSPVTVLAGVAAGGSEALLVLDQLDAVSVASGRYPDRLPIVEDLLAEATRYPRLHVLIACRQFDLDNDRQLRAVSSDDRTSVVMAGPLEESVVRQVLADVGVTEGLSATLVELLTVPLHLAIYVELARSGSGDVSGVRNLTELYGRYWVEKRATCRTLRSGSDEWVAVIDRLVDRMNTRQKLTVPAGLLDDLDTQVNIMASAGVLAVENDLVSFFHETFFDYCFARQFIAREGTLRELLCGGEQSLFRRAQVRQVLTYARATTPSTYLIDFAWLLTAADVRLHIKALVIALIQTVTDPQTAEWAALEPIATDANHILHDRLWQALRQNPAWFPILNAAGAWSTWLSSPEETVTNRTLWALAGMTSRYADKIADLLQTLPQDATWPDRLRGFIFQAEMGASRKLFEMILKAINEGHYDGEHGHDIWYTLSRCRPEFTVEALSALFDRAFVIGGGNPFAGAGPLTVNNRTSQASKIVQTAAASAPSAFVEHLLPHILETVRRNVRTESGEADLLLDTVWSSRIYHAHAFLKDDLFTGMTDALRTVSSAHPDLAERVFDQLRNDPHESAWFLLASGYVGNPERFGDDAVSWLSTTPGALRLGYVDAPHWVSRELIEAISPHCGDTQHDRLVDVVMDYTPPFERTYQGLRSRGYAQLCLLNAIDTARRPQRAIKRLAEMRRKFLRDDVEPPLGVRVGVVSPPIPETLARKMTDRQWLRAMARHGISDVRFGSGGRIIGDAGTQAQVLETATQKSPKRFANLLLRLPSEVATPYVHAILRGLAGSHLDASLLLEICQHALQIGNHDTGSGIADLIQSHAAMVLPDQVLDILIDLATGGPEGMPNNREQNPEHPDLVASRSAAALAIGTLIDQHHNRLPKFKNTLIRLSTDTSIPVREMSIAAFTTVLYVDASLAIKLFYVAVTTTGDEFLASRYVEHFLNHAIRCGYYSAVADILARMTVSSITHARLAGARQSAVASYQDPDLDELVNRLLDYDETIRTALVRVFADNVTAPNRRDRAFAVLARAFSDSSSKVRSAAVTCFYSLEEQHLSEYEKLLEVFSNSTALHDNTSAVFHMLELSRQPLPRMVLDLCENFVSQHHAALGDISTAAAGTGIYVVQLAVRLHAQHIDSDIRSRCLDLIDQLVIAGAQGIDDNLEKIKR
jgi:hypothetical protein